MGLSQGWGVAAIPLYSRGWVLTDRTSPITPSESSAASSCEGSRALIRKREKNNEQGLSIDEAFAGAMVRKA